MTEKEPPIDAYELNESERKQIFNDLIMPIEYGMVHSVENPTLHFIGGQPGAGKTAMQLRIKHQVESIDGPGAAMEIDNDRLRVYHPRYTELQLSDDQRASFYTNADASRWAQMAIKASKEIRPHVLLETSLRKPDDAISVAAEYKESDFGSELHVVVLHELASRLSIAKRYLGQVIEGQPGRYVIKSIHNEAYDRLPYSVGAMAVSGMVDRVVLHRRNGESFADFRLDQVTDPAVLTVAMQQEREAQAAKLDRDTMLADLEWCIEVAQEYKKHECLQDLLGLRDELQNIT